MRDVVVARRYAKALYELALEKKTLDDVLLGMSNLSEAMKSDSTVERFLLNPLLSPEQKQKVVQVVTSNKLVLGFISLLAERKRLSLLQDIHRALTEFADSASGTHRALVKTALPLDDSQKKAVETQLAKRFGGKVIGKFEVAKELIGGVWVRLGDKVLDATVRGRIDDFRHALVNSNN